MKHGLSKSRYTQFRTCSKALWLNLFKPQEGIINEDTLERFAFGVEVGNLAKGLLGAYEDMTVHREDGHLDYAAMVAKTKEALTRGVENICEAAFSHDGNYCAVDILHKTEGDYAIYEVKSSTHDDKNIYIWDIAYQKYILTQCGITVIGTYLVSINNEYVRQEELDIQQLFNITDLADAVEKEYNRVEADIESAKLILDGNEPETSLSISCHKPYDCAFWQYCTKDLPNYRDTFMEVSNTIVLTRYHFSSVFIYETSLIFTGNDCPSILKIPSPIELKRNNQTIRRINEAPFSSIFNASESLRKDMCTTVLTWNYYSPGCIDEAVFTFKRNNGQTFRKATNIIIVAGNDFPAGNIYQAILHHNLLILIPIIRIGTDSPYCYIATTARPKMDISNVLETV